MELIYKIKELGLGVKLITNKIYTDNRGYFSECFSYDTLNFNIKQIYISYSKKGTLRGLHLQEGKFAQAKIIRCLDGSIYLVAVDLSKSSASFGKHVSYKLNNIAESILIPRRFAVGFYAYKNSRIQYLVDNYNSPGHKTGIRWNDPVLKINWGVKKPKYISEADKNLQYLEEM